MSRKLTKFKKIKENIEKIVEEYKEAKENNDENRMIELQAEYEDQKILLYSNESYFQNLKKKELKSEKNELEDDQEIKNINAKLNQKKEYANNKSYIDMVEKSKTIDEYIENASHKKRNFVRRHFKKFALGVALVVALLSGGKLLSGRNNNDSIKDNKTNIESTIDSTEDYPQDYDNMFNTNIPDVNIENNINEGQEINEEQEINQGQTIDVNPESSETIIQLDPNITNDDTKTTTTETIIPEKEVEEQDSQDYIPSIEPGKEDNPSEENSNEIVIVEEETPEDDTDIVDDTEKEETQDQESSIEPGKDNDSSEEEIVIVEEETKPDNPTIVEEDDQENNNEMEPTEETKPGNSGETDSSENTEEKVTIIEIEEPQPLDDPVEIESDEKDVIYYDEKTETNESTSDSNTQIEDDMPIEEDEEDVYYYENPDVLEDEDILNTLNNETELGKTYTFSFYK